MELTPRKNSKFITFSWFLFIFGISSLICMYIWADIQNTQCKLAEENWCAGAGILQGLFVIFISLPSILISTAMTAISFFARKKNQAYIGSSHKVLLVLCIITIVLLAIWKFNIFLGLFNYIRDGIENIFGI